MKINIRNIEINYTRAGNGPALILAHGNGEDLHIFDKLVLKLAQNFTVYAIDSRNHGESSKTDDYSYTAMAEDVVEFIKALELENVSIVGFSDGAISAIMAVSEYGNIFKKMVLMGINLKPSDFKEEYYSYIEEEYKTTGNPLMKMMLEQPDIDISVLRNINVPTLVIAAEDDLFVPESFEKIVEAMPNARLFTIPEHDHGSYVIDNDILYPYLKDFLS